MTPAVASVNHVAVAARLTVASCEGPAKTKMLVDHATGVGIVDSVIATPSTRANGIAGMKSGMARRRASTISGSVLALGRVVDIVAPGSVGRLGHPAYDPGAAPTM